MSGYSNGTQVHDIILRYLENPDFAKMPNRTLARRIVEDYKKKGIIFNIEKMRGSIREKRHCKGNKCRQDYKHLKKYAVEPNKLYTNWLENIPEGQDEYIADYIIPNTVEFALCLFDIHFPWQNNEAINRALDYGDSNDMDCIILGGDVMDCYQASSKFARDPSVALFTDELAITREFLRTLKKNWPKAKIIWKFGNHEQRWEHLSWKGETAILCPEIIKQCSLSEVVNFEDPTLLNTIDVLPAQQIIRYRELGILHGNEIRLGFVNVNPARSAFQKSYSIVMVGHLHRPSNHSEVTIEGKNISTWSVGCLCNLHPKYLPCNNWMNGFAGVRIYDTTTWEVENKKIIAGKVLNV